MPKEPLVFLVVDDIPAARRTLRAFLNEIGYKDILEANDGTTAYRILKSNKVDFVICDWYMEQMSGIALLKVMMADPQLDNIPFLLVTGEMDLQKVIEAGKAGVSGYILKPFTLKVLKEKIESIINKQDDPKDVRANRHYLHGKELVDTGRYDDALKEFNKVLNSYKSAEVYYNIGYIKSLQKKYDEALYAFRKAVEINNLFAKAYRGMGDVYLKKNMPDKAEESFRKAGEIYMMKDMSDEAEAAFREALKIDPNTINIYNSLGIIYRKRGDYGMAIAQYQKAVKIDPSDENIHFNMARAYVEADDINNARLSLEKALEINPDFSIAKEMLKELKEGI
jgi:tetratricopeptide (TPR) repeat protein